MWNEEPRETELEFKVADSSVLNGFHPIAFISFLTSSLNLLAMKYKALSLIIFSISINSICIFSY